MHAAGSSVTQETFHVDPRSLPIDAKDAAATRFLEAHAMDLQQLEQGVDPAGLADHLDLTGEVCHGDIFGRWAALHVRYAKEVSSWIESGRRRNSRDSSSGGNFDSRAFDRAA
jgi:hypothetical protein